MSSNKDQTSKKKKRGAVVADTGPKFEDDNEGNENEAPLLAKNIYESHGNGKNF